MSLLTVERLSKNFRGLAAISDTVARANRRLGSKNGNVIG